VAGIGKASGKLILFGEHAAVYGHTAVGVSLPEMATVRLSGNAADAWDLGTIAHEDRETMRALLGRLEALMPEAASRGRCRVQVESEVPRGVGFGSSAAICSALARAALAHAGASDADPRREWSLAHDAERFFHGTPSGIDTGLSLMNGMFAFHPRPPLLPAYEPLFGRPLHLVLAAVPRVEACGALVARLGERMRAGDEPTRVAIKALGSLAEAAEAALSGGEPDTGEVIGGMADQAMELLRRLELSSPWLDRLLETGRRAGALGGKLSGAGGGGAFFLVTKEAESARDVAARLEAESARAGIPLAARVRVVSTGGLRGP
jgi:mevalonate kinase